MWNSRSDVKSRAVAPVGHCIPKVWVQASWGPVLQDADMRLRVLDGVLFFKMDLLKVISWTVVLAAFVDSVTTRLSIWRILHRATTGRPSVRSTFIFLNSFLFFFFWWNCTLNKFCLTHVVLFLQFLFYCGLAVLRKCGQNERLTCLKFKS